MSERIIDERVRELLPPVRLVWQTLGNTQPENPEVLLNNTRTQPTMGAGDSCVLRRQGPGGAILLDYGQEIHGGIILVTGQSSTKMPVHMRIRFGESASEAMSDSQGTTPGRDHKNDHAIRDSIVRVPQLGMAELGPTGFRFVRIDMEEPDASIELRAAPAIAVYRDIEQVGSFACNNERLNRIWQIGARTVHLNMQTRLWDGIKRDRLVWIGDMHPETDVVSAVFGHQPLVEESLDLVRGDFPLPRWMNNISSYSLWWIIIQHDWYLHHGNRAYLEEQRDYLRGLLPLVIERIGQDGAEALNGFRFIDWPSCGDDEAVHQGLQGLMAMALRKGSFLCETLGEYRLAVLCQQALLRLQQSQPPTGVNKQAAALALLGHTAHSAQDVRECLLADGAHRLSTFYGYYVLEALAQLGCYDEALEVISTYWGGMLDLGATSFWEHFDLDWAENATRIDELPEPDKHDIHAEYGDHCYVGHRHSLCHGWAAGPTAWLSRHVLGVRPLEPGCRAIQVQPHLGELKWIEGTFPTPLGPVKVHHERAASGKIETRIEAPEGITVAL